jgi:hypothetical protein
MSDSIDIKNFEIEAVVDKLRHVKGIEEKKSMLSDGSTISGWRNLFESISESDVIRKELEESELFHIDNISSFNSNWLDLDKRMASEISINK